MRVKNINIYINNDEEGEGESMLTTTLVTLITILERLLASGTLTTALAAIFKKALSALGVY
jgi:hypothetical protein